MASSLYLVFLVIATWAFVNGSVLYVKNDQGQLVPLKMDPRQEEELRQELRQEILNMLGLVKIPEVKFNETMMQSALEFMKNLYNITTDADGSPSKIINSADVNTLGLNASRVERAEVISAVINNAQKASFQRHQHDMPFYFEMRTGEQINAAELRIFKEASPVFRTGRFSVSLYAIKERMEKGEKILDIESSLDVEWNRTGWLVLDVTKAACKRASDPYLNLGLYLRVVDTQGKILKPRDIGIVDRKGSADKQSFLVVYQKMSKEHSLSEITDGQRM